MRKRIIAVAVAAVMVFSMVIMGLPMSPSMEVQAARKSRKAKAVATAVVQAPAYPTTITACTITADGNNVTMATSTPKMPASDDGVFYVFSEKVYQDAPSGAPITSAGMSANATFSFPLSRNTAASQLYNKFVVTTKQGGNFVPVSEAHYITNPEAIATSTAPRRNSGKKGLIVDAAKINNAEAQNLGVQQVGYNLFLEDFLNGGGGSIAYDYNGKTYYFNQSAIIQYDHAFKTFTSQNMATTVTVLNRMVPGYEYMVHPLARTGALPVTYYYMLNTADDQGLQTLEALMTFLAQHYGNAANGFGQIDNWIIGNEVNASGNWNFLQYTDVASYSKIYAKELRVCYNAIRSTNANATVAMGIDQQWNRNEAVTATGSYDGRAMVDQVNSYINAQGNIDWSLSCHPYNVPLTWAPFWTPQNAFYASLVKHSPDTKFMTMENIEQLTDYLSQPGYRNPAGGVRNVLLTEVGYVAAQGEPAQAAAIVYAYNRAMNNQYIKEIIFSRQTDHADEIAQGLSMGLTNPDGSHKMAFDWYQNMSGANGAAYTAQAQGMIGAAWNMYPR